MTAIGIDGYRYVRRTSTDERPAPNKGGPLTYARQRVTTPTAYTRKWRELTATARRVYPATCHLCATPIDLALQHNDRMAWTLDHLDPAELHGTQLPTLDRVRPAHRACNSRRGTAELTPSPRSEDW